MKQKLKFEIKEVSPEGSFEGLLSPYGNVDHAGDVVEVGAYTKTLKERGNKVPMLWQHKTDTPIGELLLEERPEGLWCKGQFLMADPAAQRAYLYVKAKIVKGLSIGFETIKEAVEGSVRRLKEIRLYEGSVVTFPANEAALIAAVKALESKDKGDFNEQLSVVQLWDAACQMRCALREALDSMVYSDLTKEEKLSLAETIISQFADAYMGFLPSFLDMLAASQSAGGMEWWNNRKLEFKKLQTKEGRAISQANSDAIQSACEHILSAHGMLSALLASGAGDATPKAGAVGEQKTEPEDFHSAALSLKEFRELLQTA